ncbi:hypothetical protein AB0J28_04105 [Streptosporangium canum]|uniref:hypothetical protein n=1 Tax=Streptosporangium canum TaxID=324952 RepID=UPI00341D6B35
MTTRPTLVVPVGLDALMVNTALQRRDGFRTWQHNYQALDDYMSPEPDEGDRQSNKKVHNHTGVHLHWTLPRGLRHGVQDPTSEKVRYPLVPNRWLVVRFSGTATRRAKAWVIESDCPYSTTAYRNGHSYQRSSPYLVSEDTLRAWQASPDPYRNTMTSNAPQVLIGLAFPLTDATPWTERAAGDPLFVTAMATGDPYFTTYTPHNSNVFSFLDDLSDLPSADTLGYQVIGWYSDPGADVLASLPSGTSYADHLAHLGWRDPRLDQDSAVAPATRSLYCGTALTIPWGPNAISAPAPDPLDAIADSGALNLAVGNTTEDAFTALVGRTLHASGASPSGSDLQLLRTFLHNVLDLADEKGGDARVRRHIHGASFGATAGGHHWTVTPPPADTTTAEDTADPASTLAPFTPPPWLATLNEDQHRLDTRLGELYTLQWRLNALWLKDGLADAVSPRPGDAPDSDRMQQEMDPDRDGSLAQTVRAMTAQVRELAAKVPQPDDARPYEGAHDAFLAGTSAFAETRGLPGGATLKAVPQPSYWQAGDPVVSLSGVLPPADATVPDEPVPVRPLTDDGPSPLVGAVTVADTTITATPGHGPMPAVPGLDALPPEILALLAEYFLLDPGNAPALAAATGLPTGEIGAVIAAHRPADYTGTLPALSLTPWAQPWEPLFMEWKVAYRHIPYAVGTQRCWTFDGADYRYTGAAGIEADRVTVTGISGLGPHPRSLFAGRLKEFIAHHGTDDQRDQLDAWLTAIGDWAFLAQELTGFNQRLAARDTRAFRRPTTDEADHPHIAGLAGYPDAATDDGLPARYRGRVTSAPYLPGGANAPFHEMRQGQIHIEELFLYDKFGRVLDVVSPDTETGGLHDYRNFPLVVDTPLAAETSLTPTIASVAQLPPRPLQPARLDFDLLDAQTGTRVVRTAADPNPIGSWILPNHLDHSLLLYDPAGRLLGTYRLLTGAQGRRTGQWEPPPDGTLATLDQVAELAPLVADLVRSPNLAPQANLTAFLDAIDATLWTTEPLGQRADRNLSVLIGRPLALVPAQLKLTLHGPPLGDTGWAATLDPPPAVFTGHQFAVRLGDQAARDDGLIGYFTADDTSDGAAGYRYDRFHSLISPDDGQDYVTQIGPPGPAPDGNYLHLTFADPAPTRLLLLLDPRAAVHATSGITPTATVTVPPGHVDDALRHLQVLFRFGPVLTTEHAQALTFPRPGEKHGTWSWLRPATGQAPWTPYGLTPTLPDAQFPDSPAMLEDGLLRLLTEPGQEH